MKTKKHSNNLQNSSGIFLPLALCLVLFTVYGLFESKTTYAAVISPSIEFDLIDLNDYTQVREIVIERPVTEKPKKLVQKPKVIDLIDFTTTDNQHEDKPELPFIIEETDKNPSDNLEGLVTVATEDNLENDDHLIMAFVDEIPIYPGCERGTNIEKRACFEKSIRKLVQRKFNIDLANSLGLNTGIQRISVKFIISKTGEIKILGSSAIHVRLEKERERVVKLIPRMKPAKQNGRPVSVSYMLPITFKVE